MARTTHAEVICEPARELPVSGSYDVLVAGGGIAGVAAAVAAAREGASVCLLDKACALGGLATIGNVIIWLPLCDGRGRQVAGGLAEELLQLSVADLMQDRPAAGFRAVPPCWRPGGDLDVRKRTRYKAEFNPSSYLLALEKLVVDAGVKVLYDTRVCAVRREGGRITYLIVENKSGRCAIATRTVVDATGDADVCYLAGEQTESLDTNVLCGWFYTLHADGLHLHMNSNRYDRYARRQGAVGPFFRGDDAEHVTAQILGTRERIRNALAEVRGRHPEADVPIVMPPTIACFRMTRRLVGTFSLGERDMHWWFEDAVGLTGDWRKAGPVYAIPLAALRGVVNCNLLTAGRCISADTTVWDVTRAIPACAVTGQASGAAAALAVQQTGGNIGILPITPLQRRLEQSGVILDSDRVRPIP